MNTLDLIVKRFDIDLNSKQFPFKIKLSRWKGIPKLFRDLGFKKGVEVGVYKGKFTKALCSWNLGLELVGVDPWIGYENYADYDTDELTKAYGEAIARNEKMNVKFMKTDSMTAVKEFEDESLDFVFIDANHDYEHVLEDITEWSKKVRKGGIVSGHDYIKTDKFDFGVIEAVNEWCRTNNIKKLFVWRDQCPSWMLVKE